MRTWRDDFKPEEKIRGTFSLSMCFKLAHSHVVVRHV